VGSALSAWERALSIFQKLGHPDADPVREKINELRADPAIRWLD
jgi:hypothetical protein